MPEDDWTIAIYVAMRTEYPCQRTVADGYLQFDYDRYRRRAEYRKRPEYLLQSLIEHEKHDSTCERADAVAHRRIRNGY